MYEWRELAEHLVELDFAVEDLTSWATEPEDVAELERLESLRDDVQAAIARRWIPSSLQHRLEGNGSTHSAHVAAIDPRD